LELSYDVTTPRTFIVLVKTSTFRLESKLKAWLLRCSVVFLEMNEKRATETRKAFGLWSWSSNGRFTGAPSAHSDQGTASIGILVSFTTARRDKITLHISYWSATLPSDRSFVCLYQEKGSQRNAGIPR
jgi:hypothetical protein